jgi:hypothetical protein
MPVKEGIMGERRPKDRVTLLRIVYRVPHFDSRSEGYPNKWLIAEITLPLLWQVQSSNQKQLK